MKSFYKDVGLQSLCDVFGYTRQAYYDWLHRREKARFETAIVVDLIRRERKVARRIGGRKLHYILKSELLEHGISIGRDGFFDIMRAHDLLVERRKRRTITTFSRHRLRKYKNLTQDWKVDKAEQLWVSDITYIRTEEGFCYLILITDAYSRLVVGHHVAAQMDTAFCLVALDNALANRQFPQRILMHHSDRGVQYCSYKYTERLQVNKVFISMTEHGDPYENALAERMNRTFKDHFDVGRIFKNVTQAKQAIDAAIQYYNERLPHSSCNMLTPQQAHQCQGELRKHWKKRKTKKTVENPTVSSPLSQDTC